EKSSLGVDDDEVIDQAKLELRLGDAKIILGCTDRLAQVHDLIGKGVQVGQSVLDIGIGDKNLIHLRGDGLPVDGLGGFEIGPEPPALKDGKRDAGGDGSDAAPPVEEIRCVGALKAGGACQSEGRIEVGSCHADLGVGSNDILFGYGNIGPARQELGG